MIITIDGPVATGKSSIARRLAQEIGYIYFDTGAMYRCITYGILKHKVNLQDKEQLNEFLKNFDFHIKMRHRERHYIVEGEDVTDTIRGKDVTANVSEVSAIPEVRERLVGYQREQSQGVNAVFEGRDMGTVVFPNAYVKVFLTGRPEVRAERRYKELKDKFPNEAANLTLEQAFIDILERDEYDMTREHSPLRIPNDAIVIDTSDLTVDEIVYKILEFKDTKKVRNQAK